MNYAILGILSRKDQDADYEISSSSILLL